jgi:oxaloacetate decarboxylase gamma subunit
MNIVLLKEGCYVMVIGMGTVFIFLVLMIFAMNIMSKLIQCINKYVPEEVVELKNNKKNKEKDNDAEIALAIAAAIHNGGKKC